jgi:cytochrome c oxidase subunit 2
MLRRRKRISRARVRGSVVALAAVAATELAGCGGDQSTLAPKSEQSRQIAHLWWGMLAAAAVVFLGAVIMLSIAVVRRRREGLPVVGERPDVSMKLVVTFGIVIPIVSLVILFVIADIGVMNVTSAPSRQSTRMTVDVTGHQWYWEIHYPGTPAVSANEIHIPVHTRVDIVGRSADVIHSFWVPELNRKIDLIPGQTNRVLLSADKTGVYRGQCAEFCGLQHAHMAFSVFVDTPERFKAWLANESRNARQPTTPDAMAGSQVFQSSQCSSCHQIRGTAADGQIGPDLTHVGSRTTLAGYTIDNTPAEMQRWIRNPQHIKPGAKMPDLGLDPKQLRELTAYLESLR